MYRIISCADRAKAILERAQSARVHSVYARTVNIETDAGLLSIHSRGTSLSPIALEAEMSAQELGELQISRGMCVELSDNGLSIEKKFFSLTDAQLWSSKISGGSIDREYITQCLSLMHVSGGFSDIALRTEAHNDDAAYTEAAEVMEKAEDLIRQRAFEDAAQELSGLVGLGMGLTPSGDDFLCGMLAAAEYLTCEYAKQLQQALRECLKKCISGTNDISAAFLICAIDGSFSRAVTELGQHNAEKSSRSFAMIGHSSGADTLNGMLYFINCIGGINKD